MESKHKKFLKYLEESNSAVYYIAAWLERRGYTVTIPELRKAPSHKDWKKYADSGDLFVGSKRIEVKRLTVSFTGEHDWPFDDFIVCNKHSYDAADPKPYAYMILSKSMDFVGVVKPETYDLWYVEKRTDSRLDHEQEFYLAPFSAVDFWGL